MPALRRFYVSPEQFSGAEVTLRDDRAHRLLEVLRLREGASLQVFDGDGHERLATLTEAARGVARLALGDQVEAAPEPPVALALCCGFPRGTRADWIIEKATELGVSALAPLPAERSVLRPGDGRLERWRRIAIEAAEQCGRSFVPRIGDALDVLAPLPRPLLGIVADERGGRPVEAVFAAHETPPASVVLYVGPEGGWSDAERAAHLEAGRVAVTLGPRVYRVDTAAVVGITLILEATGALAASRGGDRNKGD